MFEVLGLVRGDVAELDEGEGEWFECGRAGKHGTGEMCVRTGSRR